MGAGATGYLTVDVLTRRSLKDVHEACAEANQLGDL